MADHSAIGDNIGEQTPGYPVHNMTRAHADLQRQIDQLLAAEERRLAQERAQALAQERAQALLLAHDPNRRTVKDMSAPLNIDQPWCIVLPENGNFELRSGLVHHLPKFHGMSCENPINHLKEFIAVITNMRNDNEDEEVLKLKAFPFSLHDQAKHWMMSIPAGSVRTWEDLQRRFLDKFYPAAKVSVMRRELVAPKQGPGETLYDYYTRFKELETNCYNHGLPQHVLIENFLNGLEPMELRLLNACARGNVRNLYPEEVWELISENANQVRYSTTLEHSNARMAQPLENQDIKELKHYMLKLMALQTVPGKPCEFCQRTDHKTDECPTITGRTEDVNAIGGWNNNRTQPYQGQTKFGLAENGFSWRDDRNFQKQLADNRGQQPQPYNPPHQRQDAQQQQYRAPPKPTLEETLALLADTLRKNDERNAKRFEQLETQISQIATSVNELKKTNGILPSQVIENPKGTVHAVLMRQGAARTEEIAQVAHQDAREYRAQVAHTEQNQVFAMSESEESDPSEGTFNSDQTPESVKSLDYSLILPKNSSEDDDEEMKDDAESRLRTLSDDEFANGEVVVLRPPPQREDHGSFILAAVIGTVHATNCLLDTGAGRNILPYSIYQRANLPPLEPYDGELLYGDQVRAKPEGLIQIEIHVDGYPIPVEFMVMKTPESFRRRARVVLGRPFLSTTRADFNFNTYTITLNFPNASPTFDNRGRLMRRNPHNIAYKIEQSKKRPRASVRQGVGGFRAKPP